MSDSCRRRCLGQDRDDGDPAPNDASSRRTNSLQYLAKAYGITLISVNGWTNKSEPSAAELARLTRQIRMERVHALFLDSITDPRVMQRIAKEAGVCVGGHALWRCLVEAGRIRRHLRQDDPS